MKQRIAKFILFTAFSAFSAFLAFSASLTCSAFSNIPSFENDFAKNLKKWSERVYDPSVLGIDSNQTLEENVRNLFYPDPYTWEGGSLWRILQVIAAGFFVAMIMFIGLQFLRFPEDKKKIDWAKFSILYIAYGGFLLFGAVFLIGQLGFNDTTSSAQSVVENLQTKILVNIIALIKALAFFFAVVMIFRNGIQIVQAMDAEDKRKKGISWVVNVLAALVFIKLLDYVYYIAQQQDFKNRAVGLLVDVSKVVGYIMGWVMLLYLIYAGYLLVINNGDDEGYKKAMNTLKTIFFAILVVFLFLMIVYQLVKDLG